MYNLKTFLRAHFICSCSPRFLQLITVQDHFEGAFRRFLFTQILEGNYNFRTILRVYFALFLFIQILVGNYNFGTILRAHFTLFLFTQILVGNYNFEGAPPKIDSCFRSCRHFRTILRRISQVPVHLDPCKKLQFWTILRAIQLSKMEKHRTKN